MLLDILEQAMESMDPDRADKAMEELLKHKLSGKADAFIGELQDAVSALDPDAAAEAITKLRSALKEA